MRTFRVLKPEEIEVRISEIAKNGSYIRLLLYKTARTDAAILDETVGVFSWQNEYKVIDGKMYCGISVFDKDMDTWVTKWNCGTESNTEAEKGQASDALKRAGFVWGIGTELYSAPDITVWANKAPITLKESGGKYRCYDKFHVSIIEYDANEKISKLVIANSKGEIVYSTYPQPIAQKPSEPPVSRPNRAMVKNYCLVCKKPVEGYTHKGKEVTAEEHAELTRRVFGKTLCRECAAKEREKQNDRETA